jgi:hypothetical protein
MQLVIKDQSQNRLLGLFGTSLTLEGVPAESTVAQVKELILAQMGIPVEEQVYTLEGPRRSSKP